MFELYYPDSIASEVVTCSLNVYVEYSIPVPTISLVQCTSVYSEVLNIFPRVMTGLSIL